MNLARPTQDAVSWRSSAALSAAFLLASRVVFWTAAAVLGAMGRVRPVAGFDQAPEWFFGVFARFDHGHFERIALGGYFQLDRGNIAFDEAFFPGYPFAARGLGWLLGGGTITPASVTVAMSLISWAGLFVAGTLLIQLARERRLFGVDYRLMAFVLFFGPYAVFYMAPYSEGAFVACAIGAWELGRRQRWGWAAVVASIATLLRINGLFLLPMLALMMVRGQWQRPVAWARLGWLGLPVVPPLVYFAYLRSVTGSWLTWLETQKHWGRDSTWPWESLRFSIELITAHPEFAVMFQRTMEIVAVALFIVVAVQLARWQRWELVAFVVITLVSLTTSRYFQSIPRAMLSCFPVLIVLAFWLTKAPWWARWIGVGACIAILGINTTTILANQWTG